MAGHQGHTQSATGQGALAPSAMTLPAAARPWWANIMPALAIAGTSVGLAALCRSFLDTTSLAMLVLLGVALAGALYGLVASLVAATSAFVIFNFFIAEPSMQFRLATERDLAPLVAFTVAGILTGVLAGRLRDRESATWQANRRLASLLAASRELQAAVTRDDIAAAVANIRADGARMTLAFHPRADGHPVIVEGQTVASLQTGTPGGGFADPRYLEALAALVAIAVHRALLAERAADVAAAARSEELKTALLSSVSHDLRTPLAAIIASASSLSAFGDELPAGSRQQLLATILSEGERLNRLTANLLELSRLQAGASPPVHPLDPADVVASAAERLSSRLNGRLLGRVPTGAYTILADPQLFESAVSNILENAVVHAPEGPVEIGARADGGWWELTIADHGPGIPPEEREHVFERFRRLSGRGPGSGLGLAIAKGFVEASGGSIEAAGRADSLPGTVIIIRLPLISEPRLEVIDG